MPGPGMGRDSWGSVVAETEYGTSPGVGETYFELNSVGIINDIPIKPRKSLRGVSPRNIFQGKKMVGGPINLDMLFEGLGNFIKHGMGGYDFQADTPVADANTHTFTLTDSLPKGLSVEISEGNIPAGKVNLYQGGKVNTLDFNFNPEDPIEIVPGMYFQSETTNSDASGTPTYPGDHPVLWNYAGQLTLCGQADLDFDKGNISLDNLLNRRFFHHNTTREPLRGPGKRKITGSFDIEYDSLAVYDKYVAGTSGALSLIYTSTEMITGSTPYSASFTMPKIYLTGKTPEVADEGAIVIPTPFLAAHSGATDDALTIVIVNGEATL